MPPHHDWRAEDRRHIWHPYSRYSEIFGQEFPVIVRGRGPYLHDAGGRRYVDAISSWWCCNLGHSQPPIIRAIQKQAQVLQHSILGNMSHPPAIALARMLNQTMPGGPRRAFFASDGASAIEAALKIAVQYWHNRGRPRRRKFVGLKQAYHGDTLGAMAVGYQPAFHRPFRHLLFKPWQAPAPGCADCAWGRTAKTCRRECFAPMQKIIAAHADEIAAVIVEPLCQGAAGMRIYHPDYLRRLARLCRAHGILLIADEIAMGMGRTGRLWAFEHAGIDPDIVCLGKGLAAGYLPISVTMVKEHIFQTFRDQPADHTFFHGHTFAGNPLACAAAIATLAFYRKKSVVRRAQAGGRILAGGLRNIKKLPGVKNVRSLGMIAVCELEDAHGAGRRRAQAVRRALLEEGILIRPLGNVLYLLPPLLTPAPLLQTLIRKLAEAIAATGRNHP